EIERDGVVAGVRGEVQGERAPDVPADGQGQRVVPRTEIHGQIGGIRHTAAQVKRYGVVAGAPGHLGVEGAGDVADGGDVQRVVAGPQMELEVDVAANAAALDTGLVLAAKGERGLVVALALVQVDVQGARGLSGNGHGEAVITVAHVGRHTQIRVDGSAEG